MQVGVLIRSARRDRGLSQAALARAARTSQPAIARLEAGRLSPSIATLDRVLGALGLRLTIGTEEIDPGVDRTLIAQALRLSPVDRLRKLTQEVAALTALRRSAGARL